jgi:protein-S-isoprenylcysteine O-methyltransferase Ste14
VIIAPTRRGAGRAQPTNHYSFDEVPIDESAHHPQRTRRLDDEHFERIRMTASAPRPSGFHVPPPLVYAAGLFVGWLLDRRMPVPITDGASTGRTIGTVLCVLLSAAVVLSAFISFRRARTTVIPGRAANALVTSGPYQITRNPMYVSFAVLYTGVTLWLNTWWPALVLPVVIFVIDRAVIRSEERYLGAAFPKEYAEYRARVRRWL